MILSLATGGRGAVCNRLKRQMNKTPQTVGTGMPVEIGKIERELKKLWDQGGEVMSRASLMNLAVYSEAPDSLSANTALVAQITEDHACRAIVIAADSSAANDGVEAWISAHCHVSRADSKQICSEQLSFSLQGSFATLLPNIVFSHLDSDLPFYLWWQGNFHDPMDPQLWAWVDRLIYDSQSWESFDAQMQLVEQAQEEAKQRVVLCDLNWTRLIQLRRAFAQFFDQPAAQQQFGAIRSLEIEHAPGYRSTAMLLVGWIAAQLDWKLDAAPRSGSIKLQNSAGGAAEARLQETAGEPISRLTLSCGPIEFQIVHRADADLLEATMSVAGAERMRQLMPAGSKDVAALMSEELNRGGPHRVYLRAVEAVRSLL